MSTRFPAAVEARDEAFWQAQENRKRGFLGQPCCTQSKMSWALMDLPGDLAVVVHGEFDCLNCFHHHTGTAAWRFYSSRLSDLQLTTGDTQRPLEHLLRLIVAGRAPKAIVVLGTCPVEVIGDRFETVAQRVATSTGTPVLALHTSGLKMTSLTDCQDWLFESLAGLPQRDVPAREPAGARRVNLLGLPDAAREPLDVAAALGLTVNGFYPHGADLDAWQAVRHADVTVAVDQRVFPRLTRALADGYGQRVVDVPLPIGVQATRAFHAAVAEAFGLADRVDAVLGERLTTAHAQVVQFRRDFGGARLAQAIRVLNTSAVDRLVQDGLGELSHLQELGFDVTLMIQGPPEEGPRFVERLRARGVDLPAVPFGGPYDFGKELERGGFDVVIASDSYRNTTRRAGLPFLASRSLHPWLEGVSHNLAVLGDLVAQGRAR
ncbi:MAG: hypothetical protein H6733_03270 [Alphaproteobacteria bacterium]|nr:hypothetical protein [Alphaproteobacteria bacterium]